MPPNEDAEVLVQMAGDLIRQGQFDKAEPLFLQAIEIDPLFGAARSSLAFIYNIMGNHDGAIEQLTQALKKRHKDDRQPEEIYKLFLANSYFYCANIDFSAFFILKFFTVDLNVIHTNILVLQKSLSTNLYYIYCF